MIRKGRQNGRSQDEHRDERDGSAEKATGSVAVASQPPVTPSVAQRVETVLEAAELAAAEIRKDAEQWAEQHVEDARRRADALLAKRADELSSITDDLLARAHVAVRQSDDLVNSLEAAGRRSLALLREDAARDGERSSERGDAEERSTDGPSGSQSSGEGGERAGAVSAGARLLATRMAIEGSSRGTIASRLHREFGIKDPSAILREAGL